jgi:hypothetical protein
MWMNYLGEVDAVLKAIDSPPDPLERDVTHAFSIQEAIKNTARAFWRGIGLAKVE